VRHRSKLSVWAIDPAEGHTELEEEPEPIDTLGQGPGRQKHRYSILSSDRQRQYLALEVEAWGLDQEGMGQFGLLMMGLHGSARSPC
jgi:hypothetical protein